jgi:hypothetical protein
MRLSVPGRPGSGPRAELLQTCSPGVRTAPRATTLIHQPHFLQQVRTKWNSRHSRNSKQRAVPNQKPEHETVVVF